MNIINASYEIMDNFGNDEVLKKIERVARTCYKSEDKITEDSYKRMIKALVDRKHYAMLEHGSVIIELSVEDYSYTMWTLSELKEHYGRNIMLRCTSAAFSGRYIVSGNLRMWLEYLQCCRDHRIRVMSSIIDILLADKFSQVFEDMIKEDVVLTPPPRTAKELFFEDLDYNEQYVHYDLTVKFIVDRGVSHEIVRHRIASFAQESTRFVNYGKTGELTFIKPCYWDENNEDDALSYASWLDLCGYAEIKYMKLIESGASPEKARSVLPTSIKTEIVMTAPIREWKHFFDLRALGETGKPHPQMLEVAMPLFQELQSKMQEHFGW